MRTRLLRTAEVGAWVSVSFAAFLSLRVASLLLNLVDPAQCNEVCGIGAQALPLGLLTFGLAWIPLLLVHFVRLARGGAQPWFLLHTVVVVVAHAVAMSLIVRMILLYGDADTRTTILAACSGFANVTTGALLSFAVLLPAAVTAGDQTID